MTAVFVTERIPEAGIHLLREKGYEVDVSDKNGILTREELLGKLRAKPYDAVLCLLTNHIDGEVFDAAPQARIFANYAVGYDNIDTAEAKKRNVVITNTPGVLTETVAEHTFALVMAVMRRIPEADRFVRAGKYHGWGPMLLLGTDLRGKTIGILGAGRIGSRVLAIATKGYDMKAIYYDIKRNNAIEQETGAQFKRSPEEVLREADVVTVHVPLLPATKHLINSKRLALMKKTAYLINTSRGPVIDEKALAKALAEDTIKGAALDVFEEEPNLAPGLTELENSILTPHIASATEETRSTMAEMAAQSIIDVFEGRTPEHTVS